MNRAFFQKVLNRILTLFISLSGAYTIVFGIRDVLPAGFTKALPWTLVFIAGFDIISILVDDLFVSEKATGLTYLRYLIYINLILILIIKVCRPIVSTGLIWVGTNAAVVLSYFLKQMSGFYEVFTAHTAGMHGKELSSDLTENNWFVSDYINCAKKVLWALFVITIVVCGLILAMFIVKGNLSASLYISLACFIAGYVILLIIYRVNDQETSFAFLGHAAIFSYRKRILTLCVLICLVSFGAGLIISSDTALLKPEYFSGLLKVFPDMNSAPAELDGLSGNVSDGNAMPFDPSMITEEEDSLLTIILHWFFVALEYIFVGALIAGIVFFLFSAFFSKKWHDFWKNKKLAKLFKKAWTDLKRLIYDLMHMKRHKIAYNSVEAARFRDSIHDLLSGARKSKEKRAELDALTKKFMKLVDYAAAQGISFKPHMAPLEFARLLENDNTLTAGRLFEQALYAKELLTKEERTLFEESIEAVVK